MRMRMKEKSKFIFNELKLTMLNELLIINSLFINVKISDIFISKSIKRESRFKSSNARKIRVF